MMTITRLISSLLAALSLNALLEHRSGADPASAPFLDAYVPAWDETPSPEGTAMRSPTVAALLSSSVTIGGGAALVDGVARHDERMMLLGAAAFAIGPTTGHWYSGEWANPGLDLRLGGAVVAGAGFGAAFACRSTDGGSCSFSNGLVVAGTAAYLVGAIYEIATAPRAAREHNRREGFELAVAPMEGRDGAVPGLLLAGRF